MGMTNGQMLSSFFTDNAVDGISIRLVKNRTMPRMRITRLSFLGMLSYLLLMLVRNEMYTIVPLYPDIIIVINGCACPREPANVILALILGDK